MKRTLLSVFLSLSVVVFSSSAFAEVDLAKLNETLKNLPAGERVELAKVPAKPYFLLDIEPKTDQWEQFQELRKMYRTKLARFSSSGVTIIDRSQPEYRADQTLQSAITVAGRKVQILYIGHRLTEDNMYVVWTRDGEKNLAEFSPLYEKFKTRWAVGRANASWGISDAEWSAVRQLLGHQQFERVKQYTHEDIVKRAAHNNVKYYEGFAFYKKVMDRRSEILADPDYLKRAAESLGKGILNVDDILPVPYTRTEDFLPDLFIFGPGNFLGGQAWLNLPKTERFVFVDMRAAMLDYVLGKSHTTSHEFTHANPHLQNFLMSAYFDAEVWAEMATGVWQPDLLNYMFHPYYAHWRDLAKIYYGYDTEEVQRRLFPKSFGGSGVSDVNRKEFEENAKRVEEIAREFKGFIEKLLVEFYSDQLKWSVINTKFCDKAAALRIMFAMNYEPAGIFDPEKRDKEGKVILPSAQTKEWLLKEEEAGRIDRLAKLAMEKTGSVLESNKKKNGGDEEGLPKLFDQFKCPVDSSSFLASREEQREIAAAFKLLLERSSSGDWLATNILMRITGSALKEKQSLIDLIPKLFEMLKRGVWR